ncbi:hypothetical protein PNQ92_12555 [Halobacterium salinarum]|uniref:hypothetical protein n=1 Tax=Halobacterium salinarum TaxID=2242 RepID=UPI0025572776|nr:hypothetical protein [Halobacterium salinarum]MDL0126230.1 hypothetical protein [Halobacterium salinarum]
MDSRSSRLCRQEIHTLRSRSATKNTNVGTGGRATVNKFVGPLDTDIDPIYDDPRPSDVRHSHADISKTENLLDYEPGVGFSEGLEQTIPYSR